jgi:hypothetical protein
MVSKTPQLNIYTASQAIGYHTFLLAGVVSIQNLTTIRGSKQTLS